MVAAAEIDGGGGKIDPRRVAEILTTAGSKIDGGSNKINGGGGRTWWR